MGHVVNAQADHILLWIGNRGLKAYLFHGGRSLYLIWVLAGRIVQQLFLRITDILNQFLHGFVIHIQRCQGIYPSAVFADYPKSGFVFDFICYKSHDTLLILPARAISVTAAAPKSFLRFTLPHFSELFYDFAIISEIRHYLDNGFLYYFMYLDYQSGQECS